MEQTEEPGYECEICEKTFKTKSGLYHHKIIHKEYHKCEICDKCFTGSQALIEHERIHTGEKPFECEICQKLFSQASHLATHMRTHIREKPFNMFNRIFVAYQYSKGCLNSFQMNEGSSV